MRTITTKIYKFDELSEQAQQKAINDNYSINIDFEWWDAIYCDAKLIGLKIDFFDLDRNRHVTGQFLLAACEVAQNIFNNHGEHCETYKTASAFMLDWQPVYQNYWLEDDKMGEYEQILIDLEDQFLKDLLEEYAIILQNECDYLQSTAAIIETLQANEFTANGEMY